MAKATEVEFKMYQRLRWYISLRWYLLLAIIVPILTSLSFSLPTHHQLSVDLSVVGSLLATNAVFYMLVRVRQTPRFQRMIALLVLLVDIVFVTYYIYARGGVESRSQILYTIPIIASTALFGGWSPYLISVCSAAAFDGLIFAEHSNILHAAPPLVAAHGTFSYVLNSAVFFSAILIIVGALADFITRLLLSQERAAQATAANLRRAQAIARVGSWELHVETNEAIWSDEQHHLFDIIPQSDHVVLPVTYMHRIHPDDHALVSEVNARAIRNRKPFSYDFRVIHHDGRELVIHNEGKVLTDGHGKALQLYGTSQDITAERMLETAKGDFVSLASHQLRTPASGVRILLTMLRDGYDGVLSSEQLHTVEQAIEANERLLRIADDLLNVAKLEAGRLTLNKQQIEVCIWLKNIVAPQKMLAKERRQQLQLILPKAPVYLRGDADRLAMVIDNLLANARKYTPQRGKIRVTLVPGKRMHSITVADTGGGMTKDEIGKLFGKFTRLDNQVSRGIEGSGLGLYLAKSIIDLHHGSIRVVSTPGSGAAFTIKLPA